MRAELVLVRISLSIDTRLTADALSRHSKTFHFLVLIFNSNAFYPFEIATQIATERTYDLINEEELDEINNDATENDAENDALTYNIEEKRHNLTYILPSSESDRTLKNETETDERTLVYQLDKDDQRTDQNLQELATYVQNFNGVENLTIDNDLDDDEATLNMNEINLSIENLNLIGGANLDDCSELTDSIFVENNIENTKPPTVYHQINYSVASSLNNSLFASDELRSTRKQPDSSMDSMSNASGASSKSRLRSPKAKLYDLSCSPPTNTFTITKSSKSRNKQLDQSKDQALSTSGYQTSLNSSMLSNNSMIAIDKINPPSQFNQISGISSLNCSTNDCASTCESISSIGSDIYDLSAKASLNSSLSGSPFRRPAKTSTPKHSISRVAVSSKIAKPVTRVNNSGKTSQINYLGPVTPSKTDTFRKNKASGMKKSNTSSISSTASSTKSDQSTGNKASNGACKSASPSKATVVAANGNQENSRKKTISTSKSMSKIGSASSTTDQQPAKKASSRISSFGSSLWKRTVSSQQKSISSKVFKKKSTTSSPDSKKDRREPQTVNGSANTPNSMTRSSTFEKLPTSNEEAIKFASSINANKNKIRPIELEGKLQKRSLYH